TSGKEAWGRRELQNPGGSGTSSGVFWFECELGALRDHDEPLLGHAEALPVRLEVEADLRAGRDLDVLVDDAAPEARGAAALRTVEEDALLDLAERVDAAPHAEDAPMDAPSRDDAPMADERVGRDTDARVRFVAEDELRRRVVGHARADRPALVVEVEVRV